MNAAEHQSRPGEKPRGRKKKINWETEGLKREDGMVITKRDINEERHQKKKKIIRKITERVFYYFIICINIREEVYL